MKKEHEIHMYKKYKEYLEGIASGMNKNISDNDQSNPYEVIFSRIAFSTIQFANTCSVENVEASYDIKSVDIRKTLIEAMYDKETYSLLKKFAFTDVGYLVWEDVVITPLISPSLLETLLNKKGIPSYIDSDQKIFHYNSRVNTLKK